MGSEAPTSAGILDAEPFEWIADADMRLGPVCEAIFNGRYYWVPMNRLACIRFEPPEDLRDQVWLPVHLDFTNGGARYATASSNLYNPVQTPTPSTATRQDAKVYTENKFSGVALSDTLGFFDDRLLLTLGARWQRVKVTDWSNGVKGKTGYDEEKVSPSGGLLFKATDRLSLRAPRVCS